MMTSISYCSRLRMWGGSGSKPVFKPVFKPVLKRLGSARDLQSNRLISRIALNFVNSRPCTEEGGRQEVLIIEQKRKRKG